MIKKILKKIPFIGSYFDEELDWHNPESLLDVLKQNELKKTKKSIYKDLDKQKVMDPKSLFYLHKYINARFNEKSFNINGKYLNKQNKLEQLYSMGLAEINSMYIEYKELISNLEEVEKRYKKSILELDPEIKTDILAYDDTKEVKDIINSLPKKLEW